MVRKLFGTLFLVLAIISCGGGGGGGGSSNDDQAPAEVSISAEPTSIDSGDRITVRLRIGNFEASSIAFKIKFPKQLRFINSSSYLTIDDADSRFDPTSSGTRAGFSYLVFYLTRTDLGDDDNGIISFELTGDNRVEDGTIEADADIDDPDVSNSEEFEVTDPKFDTQDAVDVRVRGEPDVTPTPKVTVAPTETPA